MAYLSYSNEIHLRGTSDVVEQKIGALLEHDLHLNVVKCFDFVNCQSCAPHLLRRIVKAKDVSKVMIFDVQVLK